MILPGKRMLKDDPSPRMILLLPYPQPPKTGQNQLLAINIAQLPDVRRSKASFSALFA